MSTSFRAAAAALGFALALVVTASSAQPPEVEDVKPKAKKKIVVDDPDPTPAKGTPTPQVGDPSVKLDELVVAAKAAGNPAIAAALERYVVPFDRITTAGGATTRIKPIPLHRSDKLPPQFGVQELTPAGTPAEPKNVAKTEVKRIDHFEELALTEAELWLKKTGGPDNGPPPEFVSAAERLLAAALRYHDHAKANTARTGKAWDEVRRPLFEKLKETRVRELRLAAAAADWPRVHDKAGLLLTTYPNDPVVAREASEARVGEVDRLLKTKQFADQGRARQLLDAFEAKYPGGGEPAKRARKELAEEAQRIFLLAQADKSAKNLVRAGEYARQAEALDPNLPGLRELSRDLGTGATVLAVGARVFPERLSPVTARFDSERQAVELLFEGLLEEVPDPAGGARYRAGAALGMPAVVPGGRELGVRSFPPRGEPEPGFDANDVAETVKLYRTRPELWAAAALPWVRDLPTPTGQAAVRFDFQHGHPDPRALLTFKLLPARWLTEHGKRVDDADFSARPIGTGPFKYNSVSVDGKTGARTLTLIDNPNFGRTPGRAGLPHFREVRFVELGKGADLFEDFRIGRLHIVPDLTPDELAQALSNNSAKLGGRRSRAATCAAGSGWRSTARASCRRLPGRSPPRTAARPGR